TRLARVSDEFKAITEKHSELFLERQFNWKPPEMWASAWRTLHKPLKAWMHGDSIADIASILTGIPTEDIPSHRTAGKPVPRTLSVTGETLSSLSLIAGGFLAVVEQLMNGN